MSIPKTQTLVNCSGFTKSVRTACASAMRDKVQPARKPSPPQTMNGSCCLSTNERKNESEINRHHISVDICRRQSVGGRCQKDRLHRRPPKSWPRRTRASRRLLVIESLPGQSSRGHVDSLQQRLAG